jgi:hypothetical protein
MTAVSSFGAGLMLAGSLALSCRAKAQVLNTDLDVRVSGLPSLMARSHDLADVLPTSIDTILHDRRLCCGTDSSLGDSVAAADPRSLQDIGNKLQGRHLLPDGRPITVTAEYWPASAINSGKVIGSLTDQHALLMTWNSHLYVVYGAVYQWAMFGGDEGATAQTVIRKFLLLDTRYSDFRRRVVFDRATDDLSKVQGMLYIALAK